MQIARPHFRISRGICSSNAVLTALMSNQVWKQLVKVRGEERTQTTGQGQMSGGGCASGKDTALPQREHHLAGPRPRANQDKPLGQTLGRAMKVGKGSRTGVTHTHQRRQKQPRVQMAGSAQAGIWFQRNQ